MISDLVDELRARGVTLPDFVAGLVVLVNAVWWIESVDDGSLWLDEVLYARAGYSMLTGNPFVNPTHMFAPFAKYVIGGGQMLFGPTAVGARVGIVVFGLLTLGAVYVVLRRMGRPWAGVLSAAGVAAIPLFSTHATSAMLDIPLVFAVTLLSGAVLLESQSPGENYRDVLVGIAVLVACATKSYGFVYAVGPTLAYLQLRRRTLPLSRLMWRVSIAAAGSFVVLYLPIALGTPPDYYSGATLPSFVKAVFDIPFVGGVSYAFGASFYHNLTGHASSESPSLVHFLSWMSEGGPLVVIGIASAAVGYLLPERRCVGPPWLPVALLLPPLIIFLFVLPKGFARYALPVFPTAVVLGILAGFAVLEEIPVKNVGLVLLVALTVSPASAFVVGGATLSADSQYERAVHTISEGSEQGTVVIAENPVVLRWHLGEKAVERYYFDPTERVELEGQGGENVTVVGVSPVRPESYREAAQSVGDGEVDYVVLNSRVGSATREQPLRCGTEVQNWSAYWTGETEPHTVSVWSTDGC